MRFFIRETISMIASGILLSACGVSDQKTLNGDWPEYLGGPDRNHYSLLAEIDKSNVSSLKVAWEYHTQDSGQIQCNPIISNGVLFGMTASTQPFALDAATGKELWRLRDEPSAVWYSTSRGVSLWHDDHEERLFYTKESWLYAVNAEDGKSILSFGDSGRVSLRSGLGESAKDKFVISNTPGTIFENLIIMPLRVSEGADAAPGYIQAFDVKSGSVAWVFKTIPDKGTEGANTWPDKVMSKGNVGAANNWSGMAVDRARGIIFVPTGSAAFDFYGGDRIGQNLFANTLLALDARTGKKRWHYQLVHHDILDRDAPAPPNLVTVTHHGKQVDAVAQVTKQGFVFLFDREHGTPLFEIKELPVPQSDIPGEQSWPTQPMPVKPAPFAKQSLAETDINPKASNKDELMAQLRAVRSEGPFTPLSISGSIIYPGLDGGAEWGGAAADPEGILYVNSSEMPWKISLERDLPNARLSTKALYVSKCASCHKPDRKGNPDSGFPSLINVQKKYSRPQLRSIIEKGKGMMPSFKTLPADDIARLITYISSGHNPSDGKSADKKEPIQDSINSGWKISGYTKFVDQDGYPAVAPPWGTLNAIDLNTGEYRWKKIYGEVPELLDKGYTQTGSESYGGPVITAGDLLFIAGTKDGKIRAYDKGNGDLLWEAKLPAAGFATPSTYAVNGKQFVVIACGGTKLGAAKGDSYIAFALP